MSKTNTNRFKDLLTRKSKDLEVETADIISRDVKSEYENIVREQVKNIDDLTLRLKKKQNINISNSLLDASRIDEKEFDGAAWAREYDEINQKLALAKAKVKVSDKNFTDLFGYSYLEKEEVIID